MINSMSSYHVTYIRISPPSMLCIEEGKKISRSSVGGSDRYRLGNSYGIPCGLHGIV